VKFENSQPEKLKDGMIAILVEVRSYSKELKLTANIYGSEGWYRRSSCIERTNAV